MAPTTAAPTTIATSTPIPTRFMHPPSDPRSESR
jgi:hypothetical protein